ncbi:MAG: hypothetical protein KTR33_03345 [Gammaproteobacteria bacterium]|nr:hypothetical protein [Gammaproteobacteria bacterium]
MCLQPITTKWGLRGDHSNIVQKPKIRGGDLELKSSVAVQSFHSLYPHEYKYEATNLTDSKNFYCNFDIDWVASFKPVHIPYSSIKRLSFFSPYRLRTFATIKTLAGRHPFQARKNPIIERADAYVPWPGNLGRNILKITKGTLTSGTSLSLESTFTQSGETAIGVTSMVSKRSNRFKYQTIIKNYYDRSTLVQSEKWLDNTNIEFPVASNESKESKVISTAPPMEVESKIKCILHSGEVIITLPVSLIVPDDSNISSNYTQYDSTLLRKIDLKNQPSTF